MSVNVKGSCIDVLDFKCPAFCNLRIFNEGHQFDKSTSMVISSNRYGITIVASLNQLCLISMKHVHQLVGDFGVEKNTLTEFLKRIIELDYCPNFLDLSCDEDYIAVAGTSQSMPSITIYNVESLISQNYVSPLTCIKLEATRGSYIADLSWNPGVQNSLACCLSDGSLFIVELKNGGNYTTVSLPPQSNTLCLSWSPKGKQIIIGSSNGFLTQYKPELKAVKQYSPPTDMTANLNPIKVKWISNFQFAVVYAFVDNTDEQPSFYILNTPKNTPIEFINFEQYVIMNSDQYRLNQYYTIFQQNWNLLFVASSNCTEIGIMGINPENQWQCWMLETRPELPYRLDKQMYPIGMSLDLSSQMQIKQLSKSNEEMLLEPMPVLCVLSSDGLLFMYHIESQLSNYKNICKPPSEIPNHIFTQYFTTDSITNNIEENDQIVPEIEEVIVGDVNARGDQNESVLASYLETSVTSQPEHPQISFDTSQVSVVKPNVPAVSTAIVSPVQNNTSQLNHSNSSESALEAINQVMLKEVLEDVQIFQSQLEDILQLSVKTRDLKVGDVKDKEILVKKWTSLDTFFKELNETNRSQWAESKALQKAVLDSIAWIEDSKSRLFFLKNPKYKCLLKSNNDESFSKTLFDNIERTLFYVETQLTQVDDQLKSRYDSYNPTNKDLKIPNLESIYKSLVINTNIVNKLKEKINSLSNTVEELKYRTFKKLSVAPDIVQNTSRLHESRDVGLSKLSEQLLKITLDKDGVSAINSYNVAKKYSVLSANQRALSDTKVHKLQEWLKDFKTRRTKISRSEYANIDLNRPVCSTPLKSILKQKILEKNVDIVPTVTKENFESTQTQILSSLNKNLKGNEQKIAVNKLPITAEADFSQFKAPLFVSTTQQVISSKSKTFSSASSPLHANSNVAPIWNPADNTSTPKPHMLINFSNKFDYKTVPKDPVTASATNSTQLFGSNLTFASTSNKGLGDFSLKLSTATPLNFSNPLNTASTKSTLDIVSSTTELKEKTPFNFTSVVSAAKIETTVPKTNTSINFNFADSIKNKMSDSKATPLGSFKFEMPKTVSKPLDTSETFSGFIAEDKSKVNQETVPAKEVAAFSFNSKPDCASFSSFSFSVPKDDVSKLTTLPETKSLFTSSSTAVSASFSFSLPAKTLPSVVSESIGSPTVSSTIGNVKTTLGTNTLPTINTSNSVTETSSQVSESPTPIISEPITPEKENASIPTTAITTPVFKIPSTSASVFGTPINLTTTSTVFGSTTSITNQKSIFNTPTNSTSSPSMFNTPTNTTSASSIFITPTNPMSTSSIFNTSASTTNTNSIFGTPTNTNSTTSIFGSPTNTATTSSIFGTQANTTTTASIFGSPASTTSSVFVNPLKTTASSLFGTSSATTASSMFGSTTTTNSGGFGSSAQVATVFGSPASTSSSIFGNASVSSTSSIFGSTSTTSIFGTPATTSTTTSIFGSPSTTAVSSGLFGSVAAAANQSSSFGQSTLGFSSPGSAFGNMSLFGQACSPSQPANSFASPTNPFAINKSPSNTSSLFSNQKTVFGQPAANTPNTGFGVANTGFGSSATSGFGNPSMTGQSSGMGFGSAPVFGSMGTAYDMSKSTGFGQAPVFGGAATFGSPSPAQYAFGQNNTTPETGNFGFGAAAQQPSTAFASLAAQSNSPGFGNMAQNQNAGFASPTTPGFGQTQQTSPFKPQGASFGGTSFSSWR